MIDLDSIQLYQGPTKANLASKRSSMALIGGSFIVYEVRNTPIVLDVVADRVNNSTTTSWLQVPQTDLIPLATTVEVVEKKTKAIYPLRNYYSVLEEHKSRNEQAYN